MGRGEEVRREEEGDGGGDEVEAGRGLLGDAGERGGTLCLFHLPTQHTPSLLSTSLQVPSSSLLGLHLFIFDLGFLIFDLHLFIFDLHLLIFDLLIGLGGRIGGEGVAEGGERARRAGGRFGGADHGPQIHQRLVETASSLWPLLSFPSFHQLLRLSPVVSLLCQCSIHS